MRKIEVYLGSLAWMAVAILLPMSALEPVQAARPAALGDAGPQAQASLPCVRVSGRHASCESRA